MDEDMILPEDFEGTPTEEPEVETETNEEIEGFEDNEVEEVVEEGTPTEEPQTEPFLKITYNKEEVPLTQEEVITLSQKGMNYDKLMARYEESMNNPSLQYLNDLASRNGMQVDELVNYWKQQEEQSQLNELIQKNIPEEYAREILENKKFRQQLEGERKAKEEETSREAEWKKQQEAFMDMYPNVNPKDIPQNVWDTWKSGVPLTFAYMQHERSELMKENSLLKQNSKNRQASKVTNGVSVNGSTSVEKEDDFLKGFNSI